MRWEDERYVRVYNRDTTDWVALGWEAQSLLLLTMRKVDRAGILDLGKSGVRGLAALVAMPLEVVERALPLLLQDGCVVLNGSLLVIPNFIEAQEAKQSDAQRKREQRARARDMASAVVTQRDQTSQNVTACDATPGVTSESVTPSLAVPSLAPEAAAALPEPISVAPRLAVVDEAGGCSPSDPVYPLAEEFRRGISDAMARGGLYPWFGSADAMRQIQAHMERIGDVEYAVAEMREKAIAAKRKPSGMPWFAKVLEDVTVAPPKRAPGACPKWGDPDFNDVAAWPSMAAFEARTGPALPVEGGAVRSLR